MGVGANTPPHIAETCHTRHREGSMVKFRAATTDDLMGVKRLWNAAVVECPHELCDDNMGFKSWCKEIVLRGTMRGAKAEAIPARLYVAVERRRVVGWLIFAWMTPGGAEAWLTVVDPEFRRQGIATGLLHHAVEAAGQRLNSVVARTCSAGAAALLEREGFSQLHWHMEGSDVWVKFYRGPCEVPDQLHYGTRVAPVWFEAMRHRSRGLAA